MPRRPEGGEENRGSAQAERLEAAMVASIVQDLGALVFLIAVASQQTTLVALVTAEKLDSHCLPDEAAEGSPNTEGTRTTGRDDGQIPQPLSRRQHRLDWRHCRGCRSGSNPDHELDLYPF